MHLCGGKPPHAPHCRIQASKEFRNGAWKLDANEEPFRAHSWLRPRDSTVISPARASSPDARTSARFIDYNYTLDPTGMVSTDLSPVGFFKLNARSAPTKQRRPPMKKGVRPYSVTGFFKSSINNHPPSNGPSRRPVLPADCITPSARPCQLRSIICEANPLKEGLASPLPNERPAHTTKRRARLPLAGSKKREAAVKSRPTRARITSPNIFTKRPIKPPWTTTARMPMNPKRYPLARAS